MYKQFKLKFKKDLYATIREFFQSLISINT